MEETSCTQALDALYDGSYFLGDDRKIVSWSDGAAHLTGYMKRDAVGRPCHDIFRHVDDQGVNLCRGLCPLDKITKDGKRHEAHVFLHHRDGHLVPVMLRIAPVNNGKSQFVVAIDAINKNQPRSAVRDKLEQLKKLDLCDQLTGLANRRYIDLSINSRLEEMHRYGWPFGILFVDIDNFKQINELHGWEIGDRALRLIAATLLNSARSFDMVGRWEGEEFVTLLANVKEEQLLMIADRVRGVIEDSPIPTKDGELLVTVSVGVTMARPDDTPESLMKRANTLIELCQRGGHNIVTACWDVAGYQELRNVV